MTDDHSKILKIANKRGLHARASAEFVKCAEQYEAEIFVSKDGHVVGGRSIMGLMLLAASQGSTIHIRASGPDAQEALDQIEALVNDGFGEAE